LSRESGGYHLQTIILGGIKKEAALLDGNWIPWRTLPPWKITKIYWVEWFDPWPYQRSPE
jgi:hypothetical protein